VVCSRLFSNSWKKKEEMMRLIRLVIAAGLVLTLASGADAAPGGVPGPPEVSAAVHHDTSPPLRSMPPRPLTKAGQQNREIPNRIPLDMASRHHPTPPGQDPLLQNGPVVQSTPTPSLSFEGLSDDDNAATVGGRVVPPDTNGDVGPNHYVQTINLILAVWNKSGTRIFGPVPVSDLWNGFGGICETNNDGDPTVLYDDLANRWVISQFAIGTDGHQCVAVSTTGDPTGSYHRYDFNVSPLTFNDYPKMGVWPDGYYISANQFAGSFQGAIAVAFERSRMLSGLSAQMVKFGPLPCLAECNFSLQPSHFEGGTQPPAGAPNTFVQAWDDETWGTGVGPDGYRLWDFTVNWASPGSSSFVVLPQVNAPEFDAEFCNFSRNCIPQPAPGEGLDVLGQFTMFRSQYRNFGTHETIAISHSVDVNGASRGGVRWAELRDNGSGWILHQTGTYAPDTNSRWMSSIAMNAAGDIAIGYSVSSSSTFPSVRYATRCAADPLGTMGNEVTLVAGAGVQQASANRWGDYSSMSVDPVNDSFWFTQEYYANSGSFDFKTRIGSFNGCGGGGGCTPTEPVEVSCNDGLDNDCDTLIDAADPNCAPVCLPKGASCTTNSQCCSNKCKGKPSNKTCG
jgi:hypothetical protein